MNRRQPTVTLPADASLASEDLAAILPHIGSRLQRAIEEGMRLLTLAEDRRIRRANQLL